MATRDPFPAMSPEEEESAIADQEVIAARVESVAQLYRASYGGRPDDLPAELREWLDTGRVAPPEDRPDVIAALDAAVASGAIPTREPPTDPPSENAAESPSTAAALSRGLVGHWSRALTAQEIRDVYAAGTRERQPDDTQDTAQADANSPAARRAAFSTPPRRHNNVFFDQWAGAEQAHILQTSENDLVVAAMSATLATRLSVKRLLAEHDGNKHSVLIAYMNGSLTEQQIKIAGTLFDDDELVCIAEWHHKRAAWHEQQAEKVIAQQATNSRAPRGIRIRNTDCSQKQNAETR